MAKMDVVGSDEHIALDLVISKHLAATKDGMGSRKLYNSRLAVSSALIDLDRKKDMRKGNDIDYQTSSCLKVLEIAMTDETVWTSFSLQELTTY